MLMVGIDPVEVEQRLVEGMLACPGCAGCCGRGDTLAGGGVPRYHNAALIPQTAELLAAEDHERSHTVVLILDEAHLSTPPSSRNCGCPTPTWTPTPRSLPPGRSTDHALADQAWHLRRPGPTDRAALRHDRDDRHRDQEVLTHHLALAGHSDTLFSDDATALIHQVGRGVPRAVNNLAVQSLVAALADGKAIVEESSARAAVTEVTTE